MKERLKLEVDISWKELETNEQLISIVGPLFCAWIINPEASAKKFGALVVKDIELLMK